MRSIKKILGVMVLFCLTFGWLTASARAADIEMEIFYLPHRPALNVVDKVEKLAAEFANVTIRKYNFDDPGSKRLVEKYRLSEHMPVAIFINGKDRFSVNGHELRLHNFPKGDSFVPTFSGEWDYPDLRAILTGLSGEKK
jgi:hypothetical protein